MAGSISNQFLFVRFFVDRANSIKTLIVSKSLQETNPWDHALVKERNALFQIALTRALYDQMAPQLCHFDFFCLSVGQDKNMKIQFLTTPLQKAALETMPL